MKPTPDRSAKEAPVVAGRPALDDPRIIAAVEEYLAAVEAGRVPDRQEFLARFPDIAEALAGCLDGLDFVQQGAGHLQAPAGGGPEATAAEDRPVPSALGDFRILREIGRGGMGIVYEAEQVSLGRQVALKVLPFAATLDPKQLQRFRTEAQAAAHLHHSNIVPVHAVGCERGVYYYAMQFIEGRTLAALIAERRQAAGLEAASVAGGSDQPAVAAPAAALRPRPEPAAAATTVHQVATRATVPSLDDPSHYCTIAQLGVQAAEALDYAHQIGVVHRDIKPANLLLDHAGKLWITDFGLARCTSEVGLTRTGDLVGTLRYMSPEQAQAKRRPVDHRTDLYSLGATLYELLTLEPVFAGSDRHELLHQLLVDEPRPLRRFRKSVPRELETIVLKALAKNPEERYATAQEMADDLSRFLEDRPIQARRPSPAERLRKWARRHKPLVAAGVVMLFLIAVGSTVSTVFISREQARTKAALDREAEARTQEAKARARAEDNFRQTRQAVDTISQVAIEDLASAPRLGQTRRKLLEACLQYYQELIEQQGDDPQARAELAASHSRVSKILNEIGYLLGSRRLYLLHHTAVQEELRLTEDQFQQVRPLLEKRREALLIRPGPDAWQRRNEELAVLEKAVAGVLQPEQLRRLGQIAVQQQGSAAFRDSQVVEALRLTTEQREKMQAIPGEVWQARGSGRLPPLSGGLGDGPGMGPFGPRTGEIEKTILERLTNLLTAEQKAIWKELVGEPFQLPRLGGDVWLGDRGVLPGEKGNDPRGGPTGPGRKGPLP